MSTGPPPITAVLFDFHQTLVHGGSAAQWLSSSWDAVGRGADPTATLGAEGAGAAADFLDRVWEHAHQIDPGSTRDESPERHRAVFLETVAHCPGIDPDLAATLYDQMPRQWRPYADAVPVLDALRGRGVRTAIVSNIGFDLRPILERSGIRVDAVVLSYEVGSVKPDGGIFEHALDLLEATPEESLMVGDSWRDDAGAAALGIRTLLLPRTSGPVHGLDTVLQVVTPGAGRAGR